jgi:hypothetical protein
MRFCLCVYLLKSVLVRRQKRKIKLLNGGDGIYSNPAAKESEGNDVEMVELCKPISISQYHAKLV